MAANTNAPSFLDTGAKAGDALKRGDNANSRGEALAILTLCEARNASFEMQFATVRKVHKNGSIEEQDRPVTFTVATYRKELRSENGKIDSKAVSARKSALYATLFGLVDYTPAQDSIIARALQSAMYLCDNNIVPVATSDGNIRVPHHVVHGAPKPDASEAAKHIYEALKDKLFTLNGKDGYSLSALRKAATPKTERSANNGTGVTHDPAVEFNKALNFVLAIVQSCNTEGECAVALKEDHLNKLATLAAGVGTLVHNERAAMSRQSKKAA